MRPLFLGFIIWIVLAILPLGVALGQNLFDVTYDQNFGFVNSIRNKTDKDEMNFVYEPTKRNHFLVEKHRWGLGGCNINTTGKKISYDWRYPQSVEIDDSNANISYENDYISIEVIRRALDNGLFTEEYKIKNKWHEMVLLTDIFIYLPFHDDYPNAELCVSKRCNTHIWAGGNAAYINATRMGGEPPHLGMLITNGYVSGYNITAKESSNQRGVISLNFADLELLPNDSKSIEWKLFWNSGWEDFYAQSLEQGWVKASANNYTLERGEKAEFYFEGNALKKASCFINGIEVRCKKSRNQLLISTDTLSIGEHKISVLYNEGKETWVDVLVTSPFLELAKKRMDFILENQTEQDDKSSLNGAFLVYDNETDNIIYCEKALKYDNLNEGAERNGMGIAMSQMANITGNQKYLVAAKKYAKYVREKLQDADYTTYSNVCHTTWPRGYNYVFVANVYLELYNATKEVVYLNQAYETMLKFYSEFPGFYAIDTPCIRLVRALDEAGKSIEKKKIFELSRQLADVYLQNGVLVPEHEVNYEQTIIAPAVAFLCEFYLLSKEEKYLDAAKKIMPALESFNGFQPNYHLNEIAIRHWDGYWFGKKEMWGDTFPHYWSAFTGYAFYIYYQASGDKQYAQKAMAVVRNNMCQFFESGEASCAYIFPDNVNGEKASFYDPFANDQDYAMVYFLRLYMEIALNNDSM